MIEWDDLLAVPFARGGRGKAGMDCYGFLIECFRRDGKALKDIAATPDGDLEDYMIELNVSELQDPAPGCAAQFEIGGLLHVGYVVDRRTVLHMTSRGVRLTPLSALKSPSFFEVIK